MLLNNSVRLFLFGFLILFLELILIRYLAGNVWNLGYFPNLVLLGIFVGMSTGFVFHHFISERASQRLFRLSAYLCLALVAFVTFFHPPLPGFTSFSGEFGGDLYFTDAPWMSLFNASALFVVWFGFVIVISFLISQAMAKLFKDFSPLKAYSLDIGGSCCGILAFMAISWFQVPGWVWFLLLLPIFLFAGFPLTSSRQRWKLSAAFLVMAALGFYQDTQLLSQPASISKENWKFNGKVDVSWSPYQKIEYFDDEKFKHRIHVNGLGHQQMEASEALPKMFYQKAYDNRKKHPERGPIKNVLVIGAGSGNDVAIALRNGAEIIDAVEIDPVIAKLGRQHHPSRPYQDPRVNLFIDDGRAFMKKTQRKYDLIVFALTDSVVKVSPVAQLRLENFLFTKESVERATSLLTPTGDLLLYNYYRKDWLVKKIGAMIYEASGRVPTYLFKDDFFVMFNINKSDPIVATPPADIAIELANIPTDNWPFLYLRKKGISKIYASAMIGVVIFVFCLVGFYSFLTKRKPNSRIEKTPAYIKIAFVFMGIAFMLLETKGVIQYSLLFGTTWINNSLVFLGVLTSVLLANWSAVFFKKIQINLFVFFLIATCFGAYFYPLSNLLNIDSPFLRFIAASVITFSPIFFANLIFSISFKNQKLAEHVFGWNLLGATIGGVLEYFSMLVGYNALVIGVAICYGVVALTLTQMTGLKARMPSPSPLT